MFVFWLKPPMENRNHGAYTASRSQSSVSFPWQSGWARTCSFLTSSLNILASIISWATCALPYLRVNSDFVIHFLQPNFLFRRLDFSWIQKSLFVQMPSHWVHCSMRSCSFGLSRWAAAPAALISFGVFLPRHKMASAVRNWDGNIVSKHVQTHCHFSSLIDPSTDCLFPFLLAIKKIPCVFRKV